MSNPAFTTIKTLLVPYAKHFTVADDTDERYVLNEEYTYSRTMFGYAHVSRGGVRLIFYPLNVFPELHAGLPASLTSKIKSKYVLSFKTVTAADRNALAKLFAAGWAAIQAKRVLLGPDRGFYRKINRDETLAIVQRIFANHPDAATITPSKSHVTVALAGAPKLPAVLAAKQTKPGVLKLKTLTPAEYDALVALIAKPPRKTRHA